MTIITKPGIYPEVSCLDYFSPDLLPELALSSGGIKTLLTKTPADFMYGERKTTAAMRMGDVAHQLALGKGKGYAIGEFDAWRSNEAKEFKATAEAAGLTPIIRGKFDEAAVMADVMQNDIIFALNEIGAAKDMAAPAGGWPYQTELVFAWVEQTSHGPIWLKGMADVWCPDLLTILDPKFTKMLHDGTVERHTVNMGWDIQSAIYRRGIETILPETAGRLQFVNLLISPDPPNLSRPVTIDEAWRHSTEIEIRRAFEIFGRCKKAGAWPGFPRGIQTISAQPWLLAQRMDAELNGETGDV